MNSLLGSSSSGGTVTNITRVDTDTNSELFSATIVLPSSTPEITFSRISKAANLVYASPASGSAAKPTFRALVSNDLPVVPATKGGTGLDTIQVNKVLRGKGDGSAVEYAGIVPSVSARIAVTPTVSNYELDIVPANIEIDSLAATTKLSIAKGGTGQSTAQAAINALTSAASNADKFLKSDGTNASFQTLPNIVTSKITDNNVTYAKIQQVGASKILGNPTTSVANASEIGIGANFLFVGGVLTQRQSIIRDVTASTTITNADGVIYCNNRSGVTAVIKLPDTSTISVGDIFTVQRLNEGSGAAHAVRVDLFNETTDRMTYTSAVSNITLTGLSHLVTLQFVGVVDTFNTWRTIGLIL